MRCIIGFFILFHSPIQTPFYEPHFYTLRLGRIAADKWSGGIYFAEVTQGDQRKLVKLLKVN
jgi:hypothetical protein